MEFIITEDHGSNFNTTRKRQLVDKLTECSRKRLKTDNTKNERKSSILQTNPQQLTRSNVLQGLHGNIYQVKLLMLFLVCGVRKRYDFRLSTEITEAKKFNDLVFGILKDGKIEYRLLQTKHKHNETKSVIGFQDLLKFSGDYSLVRYLLSYQSSKHDELFKYDEIKDVILYTNNNVDINQKFEFNKEIIVLKDVITEIDDEDEILDMKNKNFRKNPIRYKFKGKIITLLKDILEKYRLEKRLTECILKQNKIKHSENDIFGLYHVALAEEVIDVVKKKFYENFLHNNGISEEVKKFRELLEKEIKKQSANKHTLQSINETFSINLSKDFGIGENKIWPKIYLNDEDINEFFDHFVFAVNQPNEEELGELIKNYMSEDFGFTLKEIAFNDILDKMFNWIKGKGSEIILYKDGKKWLEELKKKLNETVKINYETSKFNTEIEERGIYFSSNTIQKLNLCNFLCTQTSKKQIFNIITEQNSLTLIKIYQAMQRVFKSANNYIYLKLDSMEEYQNVVTDSFKNQNSCLIIESKIKQINNNVKILYQELFKIVKENENKKIVFITQKDDLLANNFKVEMKDKYEEETNINSYLTDLDSDSQDKLLKNCRVIFQGEEVNLGNLIKDQKIEYLIDEIMLIKLIKNDKIKIGKPFQHLDDVKSYYIDRMFNYQINIKETFINNSNKFIVIESSQDLINKNYQSDQDIVLICNKKTEFKELCNKYSKCNIHWIKKEHDEYVWQQSNGSIYELREYCEEKIEKRSSKKIIDFIDSKVIIAGEPGIGKSTILTEMAIKLKRINPFIWIIRINLLDFENEFEKWNTENIIINLKEALKFLCKGIYFQSLKENHKHIQIDQNIINNILQYLIINDYNVISLNDIGKNKLKGLTLLEIGLFISYYNQGKVTVLLDGFDEIVPDYSKEVTALLKILRKLQLQGLWLTTRTYNILYELESELGTFSFKLEPFSENDQKIFLKMFWEKKLKIKSIEIDRFEIFVKYLLKKLNSSIISKEQNFLSIPLHLQLIGEYFEDNFKVFYESKCNQISIEIKHDLSKKFNLATLYKSFIKKKIKVFSEKSSTADKIVRRLAQTEIDDFSKLAVNNILKEEQIKEIFLEEDFKVSKLIQKIKEGDENFGIINQIVNNRPRFIHLTFAEYFVGNYFWEKFKSIELEGIKHFINTVVIRYRIFHNHFQLCKFFQSAAQQDLENDVNFKDKNNKLNILLYEIIQKTEIVFRYKTTKCVFDISTKLLLNIIESSLSNTDSRKNQQIIGNFQNIDTKRHLALLNSSIDMGYIKLINVLIETFNETFLFDCLKIRSWCETPLWYAAENNRLDVGSLILKKFVYPHGLQNISTMVDKYNGHLLRVIILFNAFDILDFFFKIKAFECNSIYEKYDFFNKNTKQSILFNCMIKGAPTDIIRIIAEKTDVNIINELIRSNDIKTILNICNGLLKYDLEISQFYIDKGFDYSFILNVYLHDFVYIILKHPLKQLQYENDNLNYSRKILPKKLFEFIEFFCKNNAPRSIKTKVYEFSALEYCMQIHYIQQLLLKEYELCANKEDDESPINRIFKVTIDHCKNSTSITINSMQVYLRYEINKRMPVIPKYMVSLYIESNKVNDLNKLISKYLDDFNICIDYSKTRMEEIIKTSYKNIEDFENHRKKYIFLENDNKLIFNNTLNAIRFNFERNCNNEIIKNLIWELLDLYFDYNYSIDEAANEIKHELLKFKLFKIRLQEIKNLNGNTISNIDEIFHMLNIKKIDLKLELLEYVSKINEYGGVSLFFNIWSKLYFFSKKRIKVMIEKLTQYNTETLKIYNLFKS